MSVLRVDVERALDEINSQEEGMRFQGLAVVIGKKRWPELIARQRKKDFGLDAYAPARLTLEKVGKGLAASITPTLKKISTDVKTAKENFPDLQMLLFVTSAKIGNTDRKNWEKEVEREHAIELNIIEREEIITLMLMPENASLCASFLNLNISAEPLTEDLIKKIKRAAQTVVLSWARKTKGLPLIELAAMQLESNGEESVETKSLQQIDEALMQSSRIVLEGPAGRGKTTTLIQLAQRPRAAGTPFIVELPAWTSSRRGILEYIVGMPAFQAEGLTVADLARAHQIEPFLLFLNGWNEITESSSANANELLRELERDFPSAGIIVATRTHHITPPLPGALRLRLLRLSREQRSIYLVTRLGSKGNELCAYLDADTQLDELTRTPFILSEVASLFEAGVPIPSTKMGVLAEVIRLQEQRDEHRNALQVTPIFSRQTDFMKALANEMTRKGTVELSEDDARVVVNTIARELASSGLIDSIGAPAVLATLTGHHVLERIDYPHTAFQFEHQQLQEYYAALDVRVKLLNLQNDDFESINHFMTSYVNDPAWSEPLRMIAETFSEQVVDTDINHKNIKAGARLIEMALTVDIVFAGELAQLCGKAVWNKARESFTKHIRAIYSESDKNFQDCAIASMLASGAEDFKDILIPLLSAKNQQTRLKTYRLWPEISISSLDSNWYENVRGWGEEARSDFVSELLHQSINEDIANFAVNDQSSEVKKTAALALMWNGANELLISVLESMNNQTFEDFACRDPQLVPLELKPKTIASIYKLLKYADKVTTRLKAIVELIAFDEEGLEVYIKEVLEEISYQQLRDSYPHYIKSTLKYLQTIDPLWLSNWVLSQIAENNFYSNDDFLPFVTIIPEGITEKFLLKLENEKTDLENSSGIISIVAVHADVKLAAQIFEKLRHLEHELVDESQIHNKIKWASKNKLEALFRSLPDDVAVGGILSAVTTDCPIDIEIALGLLSRAARSDTPYLCIKDHDLKTHLLSCLKSWMEIVLSLDDFNGNIKADLASSISQVGNSENMNDLLTLIHADIARVRRGRAARANGNYGPLGNGATMSYASWHISAASSLASKDFEQILIALLSEPEYSPYVATEMASDFLPKPEHFFQRSFRYDLMWAARDTSPSSSTAEQRRIKFATALNAEIMRLQALSTNGNPASGIKELARALAAVDGQGYTKTVLDAISLKSAWSEYTSVEAAERLLIAGIILPISTIFPLIDSILERKWMQDSDRRLLSNALALCPFVDDIESGINKIREVLETDKLYKYELREIITALGESRSDLAAALLYELASDDQTFKQCEHHFVDAFTKLSSSLANEKLLGFVDPSIHHITLELHSSSIDKLAPRLATLAQNCPKLMARLICLCKINLPPFNREMLSKVMCEIASPEATTANLLLIDNTKALPIPEGLRNQVENAFIERRPYEGNSDMFTYHSRASNDLRTQLFQIAAGDDAKRRKPCLMLLGRIEKLRLEYGRPTGEPRHPDLSSGQAWPLNVT